MHPLEILQGYRLGGHRATVELQRSGAPGIHIEFDVLKLVEDIRSGRVKAVILTGTAGDGKTYLAYRVMDVLGLDRASVTAAQVEGGYDLDGVYIDLDLSAGPLTDTRVGRLHQALSEWAGSTRTGTRVQEEEAVYRTRPALSWDIAAELAEQVIHDLD